MKTLVLGSGITALAYLWYDREAFALAGDQPGGMFKQQVMGPQYVWATDSTRKFMKELGLNPRVRRLSVGYCVNGTLHAAKDILPNHMAEIRQQYAMKTRGIPPKDSHMSSGNGNPEVFTIGVGQLVDELFSRLVLRINKSKAVNVDMFNQAVEVQAGQHHGVVEYEKLVPTMPAPVLLKLTGNEEQVQFLKARDKAYEKFPMTADFLGAGFDYIYFPGDEPFHRISVMGGQGGVSHVIREYTLIPGADAPEGSQTHKAGQIVGGHEVLAALPPSVEPLGRYAEWRHDRRLEDVLDVVG